MPGSVFIFESILTRDEAELDALAQAAPTSAYTQTYSTSTKTHSNLTAVSLTDNTAGVADSTLEALVSGSVYATDADSIRNNLADLAAQHNALLADLTNLKRVVNAVIDDLQTLGLVS